MHSTTFVRPKPSEGTSYITFTCIQLTENITEPFTLDDVMKFFRDKKIRSWYRDPKDAHPFFYMRHECFVCSTDNFEAAHAKKTSYLQGLWDDKFPIPETISRFVIQLNLTEEYARRLYENEKFDLLSINIIGAREDQRSKEDKNWRTGIWQPVERLDGQQKKKGCSVM